MRNPYVGFPRRFKVVVVENLDDRVVSFEEIEEEMRLSIHIRSSKNDRCKMGVRRASVSTNSEVYPAMGIAHRIDMENWHPLHLPT